MFNLKCMVCFKKAEMLAFGNTYCKKCYLESPYYAEAKMKEILEKERREKEN